MRSAASVTACSWTRRAEELRVATLERYRRAGHDSNTETYAATSL